MTQKIIDNRFVCLELIGKGGIGEVWSAVQKPLQRPVALKLLRKEFSNHPQLRRRFAREARAASSLSHPNIAAVYDFGSDDEGNLFIAMELVDGPSISQAVERGISLIQMLTLIDQLLQGLGHAHARGVIHRDLKPDNVVLAAARLPEDVGTPKLVDFGIATVAYDATEGDDTVVGEVIGTPRYMSPEQALGERNLGPRTDLYNVGLLLYELATGHPPFGSDQGLAVMSRHVHDEIPPLTPREGLFFPDELQEIISRALSKSQSDRWANAADMRRAVGPLLQAYADDERALKAPVYQGRTTQPEEVPAPGLEAVDLDATPAEPVRPHLRLDEPVGLAAWHQRVPFVGRESQRELLIDLAHQASLHGRGTVVLLEGEAGVGKTRLTGWLREFVEEQGTMRASTGAFSRGSSASLRGLQEVFENIFRARGLSRQEVHERIEKRLKDWSYDAPDDALALTDFLRPTTLDETRPQSVAVSALFALLVRILEIASARKPRLIVLDDLQWAGREMADFLDYLAIELRHRELPVIVAATYRTEDLSESPELESRLSGLSRYDGETVVRMPLERLDEESGRALIETMLPTDEELALSVLERSSGNPLHLSMLLRYLRQEGLLQRGEDGRFHAVDIEEVKKAVPPNLGDLFRVRVEQAETLYNIPGRLHDLLSFAAVLGLRFQYEVLRAMVISKDRDAAATLDNDLDRLLSEGFIIEIDGRGEDWYAFGHGLMRDYFLQSLGPMALRSLHRCAALALEKVFPRQLDAFASEIAAHWDQARHPDRALAWYLRSADAQRRSYQLRPAAHALEAALEIMDRRLGAGEDDTFTSAPELKDFTPSEVSLSRYVDALWRLGDLYEGFSEFAKAEDVYRRVVRIVGRERDLEGRGLLGGLGRSWLGLGHIAWQRGDFEAARWAFQKVRELVKSAPRKHSELDEDACRGLARVKWHQGDYEEARDLANAALQTSSRAQRFEGQAEAVWLLGEIDRMTGRVEAARTHFDRSLKLYQEAAIPSGIARNLLSLAQVARYSKNFGEADRLYRQARTHYLNLGDRRQAAMCWNGLGDIARLTKQHTRAERYYRRALDVWDSIGAEYDVAVALANLGLNALALGDLDVAAEYLNSALGIVHAQDFPYLVAGIEYNLALVKVMSGEEEDVERLLAKGDDRTERSSIADIDYALPLEELGTLRAKAGREEDARRLWARAATIYEELGLQEDLARVESLMNVDEHEEA